MSLFFWGSPTAITLFVIAIIIRPAIKACAGRSRPHVGEEVFECHPAFANGYAATSVVLKSVAIRIAATIKHCFPRAMGWAVTKSVGDIADMGAAAGLNASKSESCAASGYRVSAIALTTPRPVSVYVTPSVVEGYKSSKTLSGDIDWPGHASLLERFVGQVAGMALTRLPVTHDSLIKEAVI